MNIDQFIEEIGELNQAEIEKLLSDKFTPDQINKLADKIEESIGSQMWIPNKGPQTDAYFSEADELFYGGQAGGGKSDLILGLSLTSHDR